MDEKIAISVQHVSKSFKLPHEKNTSLKRALINFSPKKRYEMQHVLKGVSFDIKKGEFFGIVGRNGSGKSTLLKMLAGIYATDAGQIQVNGSLTPFIELGVGFNPELTGRENVFLNGALLGFSHKEMEQKYDDIVEFAELGRFMDQKLKNYSSGMQVRLAFSIAIRAKSDILVLDEVLAVGDEAFQRKCYTYFDQLKREKKTVVLVTHDMAAVERFCDSAIMIESGTITLQGKPHKVAAAYSRSNDERYEPIDNRNDQREFEIDILNDHYQPVKSFNYFDNMIVRLSWKQEGVKNVGVAIFKVNGEYIFGPSTHQDKYQIKAGNQAEYHVSLNLNEGEYFIKASLSGDSGLNTIAFVEEGPHFVVKKDYEQGLWGGITKLDHTWKS
jgi:ABC-2 type transport system ATP-binding protein